MSDMLFFGILFQGPSPCQLDMEEVIAMSLQCVFFNMALQKSLTVSVCLNDRSLWVIDILFICVFC